MKCGKGDKKVVLFASGQVRTISSGFFLLPLRGEKGLAVDMRIRLLGEIAIQEEEGRFV